MTYTDLEIELEFFNYNGSMIVEINDGQGQVATVSGDYENVKTIKHRIVLPCQLEFVISNKNQNTDTLVNDSGVIVADKYVKLNRLTLGKIPLQIDKFYKICKYRSKLFDGVAYDPQWHFNGVVTIDFFESNFIKYFLLIDNKFNHK